MQLVCRNYIYFEMLKGYTFIIFIITLLLSWYQFNYINEHREQFEPKIGLFSMY